MVQSKRKTITIIGGGVGGLTAASRLSMMGFDVTLYEKNNHCGGRCSRVSQDDFSWEQGAILYLFNDIYKENFAELGEPIESHLDIIHYHDHHKVFFANGKTFQYTTSIDKLLETIENFENSGSCQKKLISFLSETEKFQDIVSRLVFNRTYESFLDIFNLDLLKRLLSIPFFSTMYDIVSKYFKSDEVRQALTFQALYFGISPFRGNGLFTILPAVELLRGISYPRGGMVSVVKALEKIATEKYGVKIVYNAMVDEIKVNESRLFGRKAVKGVIINEQFCESDAIVASADITYTNNILLPKKKEAKKLAAKDQVPSTITFFWGLSKQLDKLKAHNIFLPADYKKLFTEIHEEKIVPNDPAFYVHIANRMDPALAPKGKDAVTILVPVGAMATAPSRKTNSPRDFKKEVAQLKIKIIKTLEKRLEVNNFASLIETELIETPNSWQEKYNSWRGTILGVNHNLENLLYLRPPQRSPDYRNLYFTGSSSQPCAGVPLVMKSANMLAPKIQSDFKNF